MEVNTKAKDLSDRIAAIARQMDRLRQELLEVQTDLQKCLSLEAGSSDSVYKAVPSSSGIPSGEDFPTFAPIQQSDAPMSGNIPYKGETLRDKLSVIDLFRFQREIFGNDAEEMERVLDEMAVFRSASEVREYVEKVLHLDLNQDVVRDLVAFVTSHISNSLSS